MDVLVLIDTLDDLVHNAKPIRLTGQVRVDKQGIYKLLDQIRATIPQEIKQARWSTSRSSTPPFSEAATASWLAEDGG